MVRSYPQTYQPSERNAVEDEALNAQFIGQQQRIRRQLLNAALCGLGASVAS
jgi:hypothetical protein